MAALLEGEEGKYFSMGCVLGSYILPLSLPGFPFSLLHGDHDMNYTTPSLCTHHELVSQATSFISESCFHKAFAHSDQMV